METGWLTHPVGCNPGEPLVVSCPGRRSDNLSDAGMVLHDTRRAGIMDGIVLKEPAMTVPSLSDLQSKKCVPCEGGVPKLTPAEAAALAPKCAAIADPEASLVRAVAAGGEAKDLDKMIAALLGPEAWRLGAAEFDGPYADQLWHYAGRPGAAAKRDQVIAMTKAVSAQITAAALTKEAAPAQRIGLFRKLWADYKSAQPKIPGVARQLKTLLYYYLFFPRGFFENVKPYLKKIRQQLVISFYCATAGVILSLIHI